MRENLKKIIRNIIINEYYQAPDQNQIIAFLKKNHTDKIIGLSDYELNNIIVEASQDIDFKFLTFFKKIHEDYFFAWFESSKINRKELKEVFEKASSQNIDAERLVKDIFEILKNNKFTPENNSVIPAAPDVKFLVSTNWVIQEENTATSLDKNLILTEEISNGEIINSEEQAQNSNPVLDTIKERYHETTSAEQKDNDETNAASNSELLTEKKLSFQKIIIGIISYTVIFIFLLFICHFYPGIPRVCVTVAFVLISVLTVIMSAITPRGMSDVAPSKRPFLICRNCILFACTFFGLMCVFCNQAFISQSSVYEPIHRSLWKKNIIGIDNKDLIPIPKRTTYLLDISGTMAVRAPLQSWHTDIINELRTNWQGEGDIFLMQKLNSLKSSSTLSLVEISMLRLCNEIIKHFNTIAISVRDSSYFSVFTFSDYPQKCKDLCRLTKENVIKAVHNIICLPLGVYNVTHTDFTAVLDLINQEGDSASIRSSYYPNTFNSVIISDFLHDNGNFKKDSAKIKLSIESIQEKNIRLNLILVKESVDMTLLNVKKMVEQLMQPDFYEVSSIKEGVLNNSVSKSRKPVLFLYSDPSQTESLCQIYNITLKDKPYYFKIQGNIESGQEYSLIDKKNNTKPLFLAKEIQFILVDTIVIKYTGNVIQQIPKHKLIINDKNLGISVEYQIIFLKSLNMSTAILFVISVYLVGLFTFLFSIAYYLWYKNKNLDLIYLQPRNKILL